MAVQHQSGHRLRPEVGALLRHPVARPRDDLELLNARRRQQEGGGKLAGQDALNRLLRIARVDDLRGVRQPVALLKHQAVQDGDIQVTPTLGMLGVEGIEGLRVAESQALRCAVGLQQAELMVIELQGGLGSGGLPGEVLFEECGARGRIG